MQTKLILARTATVGLASIMIASPALALACDTKTGHEVNKSHETEDKNKDTHVSHKEDDKESKTSHKDDDKTVTHKEDDNKDKTKKDCPPKTEDKDNDSDDKPVTTPTEPGKGGGTTTPVTTPVVTPSATQTVTPVASTLPATGAELPVDVILTIAGAGSAAVGLVHYKLLNRKS